MSYTVSVNHPHFPEGTEISVGNVLRVPNGSSVTVDEDDERMFLNARGMPMHEAFAKDSTINVTGDPALSQSEIDSVKQLFAPAEKPVESVASKGATGRSAFEPPETPITPKEEDEDGGDK